MAIKMRVLYASNKSKIATMADIVKKEYDLAINAVDKIPPAYSCNNERLVILMLSLKGEPEDQLRLFCRELTKARTQNVALYVDGKASGIQKIKDTLKEAGTNVIEETFTVKGGLPFKFAKKISDEEKAAVLAWAENVVAQLQ